jgi:hypothetical protein
MSSTSPVFQPSTDVIHFGASLKALGAVREGLKTNWERQRDLMSLEVTGNPTPVLKSMCNVLSAQSSGKELTLRILTEEALQAVLSRHAEEMQRAENLADDDAELQRSQVEKERALMGRFLRGEWSHGV